MINSNQDNIIYSQFLSSLFSSIAIMGLSILCLLNNLSLDLYSMLFMLKIIIPAGLCAWIAGFSVGKILDSYKVKVQVTKEKTEKQAYEIPSMFAGTTDESMDLNNGLLDMGIE